MASVKILVVEDEIIVAKDIQDTLKKQGYDVPAIALSGEQAIEKTEQIQPDLVLMDIVLKGDVDGIEAAEQIRSRFDIPVLYLTAYTDEQTVKRAKITEPFGYITKPFDKRELYTNIEMALYKHKAEEALRQSEEKFKSIFEHANDGVIYLDNSGNILDINEKAAQMLGGPKQQAVNKHFTEVGVFSADEIPTLMSNFEKIFSGEEVILTVPIKKKKGQEIILECSASIAKTDDGADRIMVIARDITERKKAEDVIAKLAKFPDEDPYPVLRISGHGMVIYANKASANLLKTWDCRVGKSLPDPWHELVMDALSSGQSQQTEVKCDGCIFSITFAPVADTNYVNVYGLDITERKKAENQLIENQAKLKAMASERLMAEERERQSLAMGLHDEVCQKLVLTKLALESSLQLVSDSKVLASLRIACEGIGETIEQADSLTFELSNPVLRQLGFVIALEKYLTEEIRQKHGIEYELEGDEQLGTMQDEIKNCLFRVTRELLTNVVKHAQSRKVRVSVRESQGQIYVRVQDDGVGFKESQAGSKVSQTTRFGLFSIREQLEYLGGHLEIESEPGRGTKATVVVPLRGKATV